MALGKLGFNPRQERKDVRRSCRATNLLFINYLIANHFMHTTRHRRFKSLFGFCLAIGLGCGALSAQNETGEAVKITVDPQTVVGRIAPDFIGLGYETSAVAQTNYFSAHNTTLVRLYRLLGTSGLIRIGGNISDHTRFEPDGTAEVHSERQVTVINRAVLTELGGFARATGWRIMWGLNLGTGTSAAAAAEAVAVAQALDGQLQSCEIGNEVDIHGGYTLPYTNFPGYYSNFLAFKSVIRTALPAAVFSGPDSANNLAWVQQFGRAEAPDVRLLTHHYYRTGARTPGATIENLLQPDTAWSGRMRHLQDLSRETGVPWRINEVNSFYGGGKAGVSDTFAAALWSLDYMFALASSGGAGLNLETDINQLGWISHYSPIVHDAAMQCHVRPEYYGMLAFAQAGHGDLLRLALEKSDLNLTAYATRAEPGVIWLTVVNKDLTRDAAVSVTLPVGFASAGALRLTAPSVTSTNQVSLCGAEVSATGEWTPGPAEPVSVPAGVAEIQVSHASAVLLRLGR